MKYSPVFCLLICWAPLVSGIAEEEAGLTPFDESRFEATVLAEDLPRPLELDVAPDGRVFFVELAGKLKVYSPSTKEIKVAATLDVFADQENGLLGLALDPDFGKNGWVYLMYSPKTEVLSGQRISRFTLDGDTLDPASEKILLTFEEQREQCCHHAGSLEFGPDGCLYISTGDNTHPFGDSGSYAPIDERPGRHPYDAQDGPANTADLRGKILRIKPTPEGGYSIPEGNLFPSGGAIKGRPEIFVMGCRNPWRMNVDQRTGFVYWGEVGPDARGEGPRGPRGYDELNQAREAGNFGWPFFIGKNFPYADHDYVTGKTGPLYDPERPMNISPTNTGSKLLPPAQPAWIYYPYNASAEFPMLGSGGRSACAGPVYHFDPTLKSETKFPAHFDQSLIFYDWNRPFVKVVHLDVDSNIKSIEPFLKSVPLKRAVDMKFGPEGSLYILDYGSTWGDNKDSRLLRVDYFGSNRPPVAGITTDQGTAGKQPFEVKFSGTESFDKDAGQTLSFRWSVSPGAFPDQTGAEAGFTFTEPGDFVVTLTVTDGEGGESSATELVQVGNSPPVVVFEEPVDGGFFDWGEPLGYQVNVSDGEDGNSTDDTDVMKLRFLLTQRYYPPGLEDAETAHLGGFGKHATAVEAVRESDCFNCHSVDNKIVGPAFREIAARYVVEGAEVESAVGLAAERIIKGSSKVWGDIPMLPHGQFSDAEARAMVRWIFSLKDEKASAASQSFVGAMTPERPEWMGDTPGGLWEWEAAYTDFGAEGATPIAAREVIRLRARQVEGEYFDRRHGTATLSSESASGGRFIGSISPGHHLIFDRVNLTGIQSVTARVASPSAGGRLELRRGSATGAVVAEVDFAPTGGWETWVEKTLEIKNPGETGALYCVFVNPKGGGAFMNLDWLRFDK